MKYLIPTVAFVASCASGPSAEYKAKMATLTQTRNDNLIVPVCGKSPDLKQCGLVVDHAYDSDKVENFTRSICLPKKMGQPECMAALNDSIKSQMLLRYKHADTANVDLQCKAAPQECTSLMGYELKLLSSHNDHIFEWSKRGAAALAQEESDRQAESHAGWGRAISSAAQSYNDANKQYNCTSSTDFLGNVQTSCH